METRLKRLQRSARGGYGRLLASAWTQRTRHRRHEFVRRLRRRAHCIEFYHRIDDPYSVLLARLLPEIATRYGVQIKARVIGDLPRDCVPDPGRLDRLARADAARLAAAWTLEALPVEAPAPARVQSAERILLTRPSPTLATLVAVTDAAWSANDDDLARLATPEQIDDRDRERLLTAHQRRLARRGHYLSATLHYGGEWYWGLDRLILLEKRLMALGLDTVGGPPTSERRFDPVPRHLAAGPHPFTLEFFFSFRSPYSYLAAARTFDLSDRLGLRLELKPLLPMVARGQPVHPRKLRYILTDAARTARELGLPFGRLRDPLGAGVERCLAVLELAFREGREREFVLAATRGIWSEAADLTRDDVLGAIAVDAGLDRQAALIAAVEQTFRSRVAENDIALGKLALWGVPSYCLRGVQGEAVAHAWGQDRLWAIERAARGLV